MKIIAGSTSGGAGLVVKPEHQHAPPTSRARRSPPRSSATPRTSRCAHWLKEKGLKTDQQGGGDVSVLPQDNATDAAGVRPAARSTAPGCPSRRLSRLVQEAKGKLLVDEKDLWPNGKFVTTHLIVSRSS